MKKHSYLFVTIALFALFILFTVLVKTVDVQMIANGTYLGFHDLNFKFGNWVVELNRYTSMKKISDVIFYISFGYVAVLAGVGVYQLIKTKSFKLVDKRLYALLGAYVAVVAFYFIFELAKINYSPDMTDGLKCSYPSSHVFIGCAFYLLNTYTVLKLLKPEQDWIKYLTFIATGVICALLIVTRALSLKHWLTDIIGSLLLTSVIYVGYIYINHIFFKEESETETQVQEE